MHSTPMISRAGLSRLGRKTARKLRRSSFLYLHPVAPSLHNFLFFTLRRKAIAMARLMRAGHFTSIARVFLSDINRQEEPLEPLVSIIVPNYNHATYLAERLDSIFEQTYRQFEVILLDDASSDGSQSILHHYHARHPERSQLLINEQNSGSPFQQWRRGLQLARGELIWIAESDDFCDRNFLSELVPQFANPATMLAFCRIHFVDESGRNQVWSMPQYLPELSKSLWDASLVSSAHQLTRKNWNRRNLIPNVSATLFRNCKALPLLRDEHWLGMKICGDWLFYLHLTRGGLVAYTPETTSYYRQHPQNSSVSLHQQRIYLEEHLIVAEQLLKLYSLDTETCHAMQAELRRRWLDHRDDPIPSDLLERLERLHPGEISSGERNPNLLIVTYSLIAGGGEILPIRLANILKELGFGVTVLNCHQHPNQPGVRRMLRQDIPMIELNALDALGTIIQDFGIELVHSHHAWVDTTICELLHGSFDVCHVITSHGMYDEIEADEIVRIGALLRPWVRGATYVADRNLEALLRLGLRQGITAKIANAIDPQQAPAIERASLNISDDAFVICLVSRGIREKGWQEAMEAVRRVRLHKNRDVQLLIVGDGQELHRLQPSCTNDFIHFLGFQAESARYFASADLGILPSFYPGESQPLTLLECLGAGRPYLASDLGEIRAMLTTPEGLAGQVVPLEDGKVNPQAFADCLSRYLDDPALLERHTALARIAARKFDPVGMGRAYSELYRKALTTNASPTY
jgi:glycosyltransferase involved in cell wall biosynthesis